MASNLYSYDRATGVLIGTTGWLDNPERPDKPLQPAFTTTLAPPDVPAGQAAVFRKGAWTLQPDHRGERWWSGTDPVQIETVGDPAAQGLTRDPVVPPAPPASSCSRLGLKRAFEEQDLWPIVRGMIAADREMSEDWNLAVEIHIADPIVQKAVAGLAAKDIALSDADVQALVTRANELVAPPRPALAA